MSPNSANLKKKKNTKYIIYHISYISKFKTITKTKTLSKNHRMRNKSHEDHVRKQPLHKHKQTITYQN